MQALLPYALFVVMLAQGAALSPDALRLPAGAGRAAALLAALRIILLPLIALVAGWVFDVPGDAALGIILTLLTPVAIGALPLGGVAGGNLALMLSLIHI